MRMPEPYDADIEHAAAVLRAGGLVAFPTETVYGLGADASNPAALARLFATKGRPKNHPVIVHVARVDQLDQVAVDVPEVARRLARAFWPGPLTLLLRRRERTVAPEVTGGRTTVGVRVPDHPVALALLTAFDGPVAAPSANRFGKVSPTTAAHVRTDLGDDVDLVLDGGACAVGVESTIVDVTVDPPTVVRVGGITENELAVELGYRLARANEGTTAAPGTLPSHYAPNARVEVVAAEAIDDRVATLRAAGENVSVLDAPGDPAEYARVLYGRLRAADRPGIDVIVAVAPDDDGGLGTAVADRLRRAAAG
jgi:L-threonylcarbamoyladenylate synthase